MGPVPAHRGQDVSIYFDRQPSQVGWKVFNVAGQMVAKFPPRQGLHYSWNTGPAAPGLYFFEIIVTYPNGSTADLWRKALIVP